MARSYNVRTTALTLGVTEKWIDNLLSHHDVFGVSGGRQGVQRSISPNGLLTIEIARRLIRALELPVRRAVAIASGAVATRSASPGVTEARIDVAEGVVLVANMSAIEVSLRERLFAAVESTAQRSRGRPRARSAPS